MKLKLLLIYVRFSRHELAADLALEGQDSGTAGRAGGSGGEVEPDLQIQWVPEEQCDGDPVAEGLLPPHLRLARHEQQ